MSRTDHGINEQMLISRVIITDPGRADGQLTYAVEALSGEAVGGWVSFFQKTGPSKGKHLLFAKTKSLSNF